MGNDPPELNDENSKIKVTKFIEGNLKGLKELLKVISLIFFILLNLGSLHSHESFSYAFITNQESNKVDVIDLKKQKKIKEISVGNKPAGIALI